jgi:hypothetical protein
MSGSNSSDVIAARAELSTPEVADTQPLGLTVYDLPTTQDALAAQRSRQGRWKMLGVLLVCAAPVVASYFTYYVVRPEGRRNFGALIEPQRNMPEQLTARTLDGVLQPLSALRGQWLLISTSPANCNDTCQHNLYLQRQLRESLGREKDRLDWVWLITDDAPVPDAITAGIEKATVLRVDRAALAQWLEPAAGQSLADHLYLVDPQGHWMMRFPAKLDSAKATQAKRDLDRLLRASASWDQPGRLEQP